MEKRGLAQALTTAGATATSRIAWADEMRLGLLGCTRRRWNPRGEKLVQPRQQQFTWAWLLLAVDIAHARLFWQWLPNVKKLTLHDALTQHGPATALTHVVWDNAPSHHAKLLHLLPLQRVFLPAYAPELNPAERIFEEIRRWVEGQVYLTLEAKQHAVTQYLTQLAADPDRLRSLVGWAWIVEALPKAPS